MEKTLLAVLSDVVGVLKPEGVGATEVTAADALSANRMSPVLPRSRSGIEARYGGSCRDYTYFFLRHHGTELRCLEAYLDLLLTHVEAARYLRSSHRKHHAHRKSVRVYRIPSCRRPGQARLCRSRAATWVEPRSLSVIVVWRIVSHRFIACRHGLDVTLDGRIEITSQPGLMRRLAGPATGNMYIRSPASSHFCTDSRQTDTDSSNHRPLRQSNPP
jgi:hypothetical protein